MILNQSAKDEKNRIERTNNLIEAVKAGKLLSLVLEPASICNLTCKFCELHSGQLGSMPTEKGIMSFDLYRLIIDEINNLDFKFETVFFLGNGEPLLNKNLVDMISMAVKRRIARRYVMFTNGTLMNPDIFDRLMDSGIDEINVSLDTINPEVYKEVKGKDLLATVLNNIDYAIKRVLHSPIISLVIKCCEGGGIYGLGDENIQHIISKYRDVVADSQHIHIKNVPIVKLVDAMIKQTEEFHEPCELAFYMSYIKYDGRVSICCVDTIDALNIGRIGQNQSLKDILKGQKLHNIRKIHLSRNLDQIPLCKYCGNRTVVDLSDYRDELLDLI